MGREHLIEAAARRSNDALDRSLDALKRLRRAGTPISFVAVAREAGVSTDFLYSRPEIRSKIEVLRDQRPIVVASRGADAEPLDAPVTALAGRMKRAKDHYEAEIARLNAALAAAHGENLALRRRLTQAGISDEMTSR